MNNEVKIWVDPADMENILLGINELAVGMTDRVYSYTAHGILTENKSLTDEQNAQTFVFDYYELTAGAFRLIAGATSIIVHAIANDELGIKAREAVK